MKHSTLNQSGSSKSMKMHYTISRDMTDERKVQSAKLIAITDRKVSRFSASHKQPNTPSLPMPLMQRRSQPPRHAVPQSTRANHGEQAPTIYYGSIASGTQIMKDGLRETDSQAFARQRQPIVVRNVRPRPPPVVCTCRRSGQSGV